MAKINQLQGERFGMLIATDRAESTTKGQAQWRCLCDCGGTAVVRSDNLRSGKVTSCGCKKTGRKTAVEKTEADLQENARRESIGKAMPWLGVVPAEPFVKKIQLDGYDSLYPIAGGIKSCGFGHAKGTDVHGVEFETFTNLILRQRRQGTIPIVALRTLDHLAALGHITAQGKRTIDQWMFDCGVAFTMRQTGDTHSIGLEFEKLGGPKVWPR